MLISDCGFLISDCGFPISDFRFLISDFWFWETRIPDFCSQILRIFCEIFLISGFWKRSHPPACSFLETRIKTVSRRNRNHLISRILNRIGRKCIWSTRDYYHLLLLRNTNHLTLVRKDGKELLRMDRENWTDVFKMSLKPCKENNLREFFFTFIHMIVITKKKLFRYDINTTAVSQIFFFLFSFSFSLFHLIVVNVCCRNWLIIFFSTIFLLYVASWVYRTYRIYNNKIRERQRMQKKPSTKKWCWLVCHLCTRLLPSKLFFSSFLLHRILSLLSCLR